MPDIGEGMVTVPFVFEVRVAEIIAPALRLYLTVKEVFGVRPLRIMLPFGVPQLDGFNFDTALITGTTLTVAFTAAAAEAHPPMVEVMTREYLPVAAAVEFNRKGFCTLAVKSFGPVQA